jgi:hypothetical protein
MKRRSARPFTVEVKHTRNPRASLNTPAVRTGPAENLWKDLPSIEAPPATPTLQAAPQRPASEVPVRRVLPSLVPMFDVPVEPDAAPEPEPVATIAVRRPRTKPDRVPVANRAARTARPEAEAAPPAAVLAEAAIIQVPAPAAKKVAANRPASQRLAHRRAAELPLGERWKRRLPNLLR